MDFAVSSLDSLSRKTWVRKQNLVSVYPRCRVISENVTGGHFENGAILVVHPNLVMVTSTFHDWISPRDHMT